MDIFSYLLGKKAGGGGGGPVLQQKNITIQENGETNVTPDSGYDGLSSVKVTTNVASEGISHPEFVSFMNYADGTLDVSWLRTDNITNMARMFQGCSNLTALDLSNFDLSNVTTMYYFLYSCSKLLPSNINGLLNLDTSNVQNFESCLERLGSNQGSLFTLDLSNWDFSSATTCAGMFRSMSVNFRGATLNSPNNPNLTNTSQMFYANTGNPLNIDMTNFDVSKVSNASSMFTTCHYLTNDSLNSIMKAFTNNTGLASADKNLRYLGFSSALATTCTGLSNWEDMQAAGWTTGY